MTLKEQIMKLQTYKMHEGEDTVYVERDDVIKTLEQAQLEEVYELENAEMHLSEDCAREVADIISSIARNLEHICEVIRNDL